MRTSLGRLALLAASVLGGPAAFAMPENWGINFQPAATAAADGIHSFHEMLLYLIVAVTLFVLALLIIVMVRFNKRANPVPSKTTHNTLIEVVWTVVPVVILVVIAIPSFKLLYANERIPPDIALTIKAIGKQWYWSYEYPDNGNFTFDSYMISDADLQQGQKRLLETDNRIVLPIETNIRLQTTAADVLHSWAMQQFGIKIDAVPGRLNEQWMYIEHPGTYYGQCSELCGVNHGFMPITIEAVTKEQFQTWVTEAQTQFAKVGDTGTSVADAAAATPAKSN